MIITIDGLSATGKSTVAKMLADTLGFTYFNTGLIYRFVTFIILKYHLKDVNLIIDKLNSLSFMLDKDRLIYNDKDITSLLYTEEMDIETTKYSVILEIKEWVRNIQKEYISKGNIIIEGRDIGTSIAPFADKKFYLYASLEERARRLCKRGFAKTVEVAMDELRMLDANNIASKDFIKPTDAIEIDTTNMTLDELYQFMLKEIKA